MSKVFVVSDTWFNRPLNDDPNENVPEMNESLINSWNKSIGKDDIVYVLGGFGISELYSIVIQLNGKIHFLDNFYLDEDKECISTLKDCIKNSIDKNLKNKITFEKKQIVVLNQYDVILSYFPLSDWIGRESGTFCFHGMNDELSITEHSISCNIHRWNYSPVDLEGVINNIKSFENNI